MLNTIDESAHRILETIRCVFPVMGEITMTYKRDGFCEELSILAGNEPKKLCVVVVSLYKIAAEHDEHDEHKQRS